MTCSLQPNIFPSFYSTTIVSHVGSISSKHSKFGIVVGLALSRPPMLFLFQALEITPKPVLTMLSALCRSSTFSVLQVSHHTVGALCNAYVISPAAIQMIFLLMRALHILSVLVYFLIAKANLYLTQHTRAVMVKDVHRQLRRTIMPLTFGTVSISTTC